MVSEETSEYYRLREMGRVVSNIFLNIDHDGLGANFRTRVIKDLESWNHSRFPTDRNITMHDLAEFMLQVAGCIFSPQEKEQEEAVDVQGSR